MHALNTKSFIAEKKLHQGVFPNRYNFVEVPDFIKGIVNFNNLGWYRVADPSCHPVPRRKKNALYYVDC